MSSVLKLAAVLVALFTAAASIGQAADMTVWVGRDVDNNRVFWTCTNTNGDDWILKRNGERYGTFQTVASTGEYIELQLKGTSTFNRVRLHKDRLEINEEGSRFKWIPLATGKWS